MLLRFSKMHGIGNDFVVLDCITQRYAPQAQHMAKLADRHFGIGCDQLLIVEPPEQPENDFRYRIFNADGSEVEQCGNGARCFAHGRKNIYGIRMFFLPCALIIRNAKFEFQVGIQILVFFQ